jgi:uncharacterized protein (TIGR02118 family)
MYNLILLAAGPPDWTHEQFITWWRGEHAELTVLLPGLRRWQHTEIDAALEPRSEGWDGISILGFDSKEAMTAALDSPQWKAAIDQVGDMRGKRIAVMGSEQLMFGV